MINTLSHILLPELPVSLVALVLRASLRRPTCDELETDPCLGCFARMARSETDGDGGFCGFFSTNIR